MGLVVGDKDRCNILPVLHRCEFAQQHNNLYMLANEHCSNRSSITFLSLHNLHNLDNLSSYITSMSKEAAFVVYTILYD